MVDRENKVIVHPTKYKNSSNCLHIVGENYKHIKVNLNVGLKCTIPVRSTPTLVSDPTRFFGDRHMERLQVFMIFEKLKM